MIGLKERGLRFELTAGLALLVAAAVGWVGLAVFKYAQQEMLALKIENGLILARTIEERFISSPTGQDLDFLVNTLSQTGFEGIRVINQHGKTLVSSKNWSREERPDQNDLTKAIATGRFRSYMGGTGLFSFGPDPTLALVVPIYKGSKVVGAVGLSSSLTKMRASWARTRWIILLYLTIDTVIMVLFGGYLLSRRLIQPLSRMLARVKALAEGEYSPYPAPVKGTGEIGELEEAFEKMALNLTENRKKLEENLASLKAAQIELVKSEKMATVGRLASGLAHELGNPLSSIQGFTHILRRQNLPQAERDDFFDRTESELLRMDSIIRSLLDFARPVSTEFIPSNLNSIVTESLSLVEVQKWFKGLKVVTHLEQELPSVLARENQLIQVLLNLLTNAGQSMPDGGALTLETGTADNCEVYISVTDTGTGISLKDQKMIFDPFFTTKEPGQGTGLGLSLSQSIVENLGGRVEVRSTPGEGSRFTVFLPWAKKEGE